MVGICELANKQTGCGSYGNFAISRPFFLLRKTLLFETGLNLFLTGARRKEFMTDYKSAHPVARLYICLYTHEHTCWRSSPEVQSVLFLKLLLLFKDFFIYLRESE